MSAAPEYLTHNPVYHVTYHGSDPTRGHVYVRADIAATPAPDVAATPAARWLADGQPDPHGNRFGCERAALPKGDLTDDELANGIYMASRTDLDLSDWQEAAKQRIRWLSRALTRATAPDVAGAMVEALECIMDGYGLNAPDYRQQETDEHGELIEDDWIVARCRAALRQIAGGDGK